MHVRLVRLRQRVALFAEWLHNPQGVFDSRFLHIVFFTIAQFARFLVVLFLVLLEIPSHFRKAPMFAFSELSARDEHGQYLESYNGYLQRMKLSVSMVMLTVLAISIQFFTLGYGIFIAGRPQRADAYSSSVTLNPTYDITGNNTSTYIDDGGGGCIAELTEYSCESASSTILKASGQFHNFADCSLGGYTDTNNASEMQFSLASIPTNATITSVQLTVNVSTTTSGSISVVRGVTDDTSSLACADVYNDVAGSSREYVSGQSWGTTGSKSYTLGALANADVQARLTTTQKISFGIFGSIANRAGAYASVDAAANKPQLVINYTLPPQAPTATSHSTITTTSITWTWTDNATAETRYDVHNASHSNVTGCTNLAAGSQSCTETGLTANTQYTRHPNVTDANGNTDGSSASSYTAIQTPTNVTQDSVTTTSFTVHAGGTISNLGTGQAALFFNDTTNGVNSGWVTTNTWTRTGLTPSTIHRIQVKARNGDGIETSYTALKSVYTQALPPNIISDQTTSTWYNTSTFTFNDQTAAGITVRVWDQNLTYTFPGTDTPSLGETPFIQTATVDGDWYLHTASYDIGGTLSGGVVDYGPYQYDGTAPTTPASVTDGLGSDLDYQSSTTAMSAHWSAATDVLSGLGRYEYAIGTTSGGVQTRGWTSAGTSTSVTATGLSLTSGVQYFVSVRAVDTAGNAGGVRTANGVTVNTDVPVITDTQSGDTTPRNVAGTTYTVSFSKSASGPNIDLAEYAIYAGANQTGTLVKNWTTIFSGAVASYATPWTIDFSSLPEGTAYVSVRVHALDGLTNELGDAFTVLKDTLAPTVNSFVAAPTDSTATLTWTTTEPATTQIAYGLTSGYGTLTTLDATLSTSHSVTISGLANDTSFHAQALSADQAGNAVASADLAFTTASGARTYISNVLVSGISPTSVVVSWTTNEPATSKVRYGLTTDYGLEALDLSLVTTHTMTLTGLTAGQTYHYEVISVGSTTDHDADATFQTSVEVPTPEPTATARTATPVIQQLILPTTGTEPLIVAGIAHGGQVVRVYVDGKSVSVTKVSGQPNDIVSYVLKVARQKLSPGTHIIKTRSTNADGVRSDFSASYKITVRSSTAAITSSKGGTYTVKSGDSLWSIAHQFLGNGVTYQRLVNANIGAHPSLATNPSLIQPGWVLKIPAP